VAPATPGHLFANYSIAFTTTLRSFEDATITIDFPAAYGFDTAYDPWLDNIPFCGLLNVSDSMTVSYGFTGQRAKISQFKGLVKGQRVQLGLFSITNPAVTGTYTLTISVRSADGNVVESGTIDMIITGTTYSAFTFNVDEIKALPSNAKSPAIYFFRFVPAENIPRGSEIALIFPASY
jgi:hypothetical protein